MRAGRGTGQGLRQEIQTDLICPNSFFKPIAEYDIAGEVVDANGQGASAQYVYVAGYDCHSSAGGYFSE